LLSVCVGLIVLLGGWGFNVAALRVVVPGYPAMVPNTAAALLLFGAALLLGAREQDKPSGNTAALICAAIAALLGAATLFEFISGMDLSLDRLLFPGAVMPIASGRMSIASAVAFSCLGGALLLSRTRRSFLVGQYLALIIGLLALFNVIGQIYAIDRFRAVAFQSGGVPMAIHTSLTVLVLCAGALLARPRWGIMSTITSSSPGGVMTRRLLPAALLIPIGMGWLRKEGQLWGFYDDALGRVLFTSLLIAVFALLIWTSGQLLNRMDTERARAEWGMRQLANSMPLMVWTAKPDGETDYFNQRSHEYIGLQFEEIRDGGWVAAIHPDDVEGVVSNRRRAFSRREPYTLEYRFRRASDGMYRWHLAQGIPVFNPAGEVSRWIGTCTDVHSIKLVEDALRNSESHFRLLADSMPQMVWTAKQDGSIDYYNQSWQDYTGMDIEQSKNWGWQPALHPDDLQTTIHRWTTAFTTGAPYQTEFRLKRADGEYRWHVGRARPIRNALGAVERWFGTCTDIEAYKQAEAEIRILNENLEERVRQRTAELAAANCQLAAMNAELEQSTLMLEQSNRELQDFASVASHDLQEPLRKVQAFGDRLKTVAAEVLDAQARDYLDRMLNASKRMKSLIDDLLRFARVTSQAQPFLPVDLNRVTREVLCDLEVRIAETNALLEVGELPTIDADEVQMRQLLQNLLGNALKFHQPGKPPVVRVFAETADAISAADGLCRLNVEDNGIGFEEKYLDRIFTVFQRLHGRAEYEGTGVGLAICRKITQRHGGDITAKSAPGQGASFKITLPFRQANGADSETASTAVYEKNSSATAG
jgi:PAS domain S-box-containing protein